MIMMMTLSLSDLEEDDNEVDDEYEYDECDQYDQYCDDNENDLAEGYKSPKLPTKHVPRLHAGFVHHPLGPGGDHIHDHVSLLLPGEMNILQIQCKIDFNTFLSPKPHSRCKK